MSIHFHALPVRSVERDAEALVVGLGLDTLDEAARAQFRFKAGQYLTLRAEVDGEDVRRTYSLCSPPGADLLRVGIRQLPGGRFSGWAARTLAPGQTLQVMPPDGHFAFSPEPQTRRHVLCIAGGSGITPMLSIIATLLAEEPLSRATLIYANRSLGSTMFREELAALKNRHLGRLALHHVFSREAQEVPLFHGRLDEARVTEFLHTLVPVASIDEAWVCGPVGLIDGATAALNMAGLPASRVHVERFGDFGAAGAGVATPHAAQDTDLARVGLLIDGTEREIEVRRDDASILDAGLRQGLDLPYACKGGVCSTCRGKVLEGQVRMDRNYALTADEVDQGFVLCCQAHAVTPRVRISLDER